MANLTDKVVLITGASGSIGRGTAVAFAKEGCKLALTGRDQARLDETAKSCREAGAKPNAIFVITGDATNPDDAKNIVDGTVQKFGRLDVLVNGAGIIRPGVFLTTKMTDYDDIFNTNLKSVFIMCKAAMSALVESKGAIVNVSSFTGIRPCFVYFAYSMCGATIDMLTRGLALELGPKGVRVNSVNPGVVKDSDAWKRPGAPMAAAKPGQWEKSLEYQKNLYPLDRLTTVEDVAKAIVFLASDNASFINGVILPVDGGKILTSKGMEEKPLVA